MPTIAEQTPHEIDSARLAMLVAMDIAEEYQLLKTQLEGEEGETTGEEKTTEEASSSDSGNGEAIGIRPGMKLYDEYGNYVCELGEPRKPLTEEDRQRNRERRQGHYKKRWYENQLLAIAKDESLPAKERHEALFTLGKSRGYHRGGPGKT